MSQAEDKKKASSPVDKLKSDQPEGPVLAPTVVGDAAGAGSVEKIRDILFGAQMRDYEKKFSELKERMLGEIGQFREETRKHFETMELYVKKEIESLSDRLTNEQNDRSEAAKELSQDLKDAGRALEKKIAQLDDLHSRNFRDLRQQLLDQSQTLSAEIRQKREEAALALERLAEELRSSKVNRANLSEIFVAMAMRLTNDAALKSAAQASMALNE
jgi:hypothetical protein